MISAYDKTREHFKAMQVSSAGVCAEMTGLEPAAVCEAMKRLIKERRIVQIPDVPGLYKYMNCVTSAGAQNCEPLQATPEQQKLWTAMNMPHNRPAPFTIFSVAQLAGVTELCARTYVGVLTKQKLVRRINNKYGCKGVYRVEPGAPAPDSPPIKQTETKEAANG